jgi:hypothetical protein
VGHVPARIRAGVYRYSGVAVAGFAVFTLAIGWVNIFAVFRIVGTGCLLGVGHTLQKFTGSEAWAATAQPRFGRQPFRTAVA